MICATKPVNGESIDSKYIRKVDNLTSWEKDKVFVRALADFHFTKFRIGRSHISNFTSITGCVDGGSLHNTHLHSEKFDFKSVKEIKQSDSPSNRISLSQLNLSQKGRDFIKEWETFKSSTYNDSEGYCTIGYGHLIARNKCENITIPDEFKNGITKERAIELFEERIPKYEKGVKDYVKVNLYQHEYDALVSLLFNCGENYFRLNKAPKLLNYLNESNYQLAASELLDITNGGTDGLIKRRRSENNLFLNNIYNASH